MSDEWDIPWEDAPQVTKPAPMASFEFDDDTCAVCNRKVVSASGPKYSPIMIIGEFPGAEELSQGVVMIGRMGAVLRQELSNIDIDMQRCRKINLWQHEPIKSKKPPFIYDEAGNPMTCFDLGFQNVIKEAQDRKAILLMGSDVVLAFVGKKVSEVNGLMVSSPRLPDVPMIACVNPAIVFHESVGELKFALKNFSKIAKGLL